LESWEYNELVEAINEDYNKYVKLNRGLEYAIARTVNDYMNMERVEDFIVDTVIGEILLSKNKVFIGYVEGIKKRLSMFEDLDVTSELTHEEIADLTTRIEKVLDGLSKVEIDYNPYSE
jgi:hypothetical protein